MKLFSHQLDGPGGSRREQLAGTLIEVMFASGILTVVVLALMSAHLMG